MLTNHEDFRVDFPCGCAVQYLGEFDRLVRLITICASHSDDCRRTDEIVAVSKIHLKTEIGTTC